MSGDRYLNTNYIVNTQNSSRALLWVQIINTPKHRPTTGLGINFVYILKTVLIFWLENILSYSQWKILFQFQLYSLHACFRSLRGKFFLPSLRIGSILHVSPSGTNPNMYNTMRKSAHWNYTSSVDFHSFMCFTESYVNTELTKNWQSSLHSYLPSPLFSIDCADAKETNSLYHKEKCVIRANLNVVSCHLGLKILYWPPFWAINDIDIHNVPRDICLISAGY
jgi:hypothetical protein